MNTKKIIIVAVITVIVFGLVLLIWNLSRPDSATSTSEIESSEVLESTDDEISINDESQPPKSEYDYSEVMLGVMREIYPTNFQGFHMKISTSSKPDTTYASTIHLEDVITFSNPPESHVDFSKLRIIGLAHEDMLDPFTHNIDDFKNIIFETTPTQLNEEFIAEANIGYDTNIKDVLDVLFVYDDVITFHTMFIIDKDRVNTYDYWQNQYPNDKIISFQIQCGDKITEYFTIKSMESFSEWTFSPFNIDEWGPNAFTIVDTKEEWMIPEDIHNAPIMDGAIIVAQPYVEPKPKEFMFDDNNPIYATSYLGLSEQDLIQRMGTYDSRTVIEELTIISYKQATFYIENDDIVQINILSPDFKPINDFITEPTNDMVLADWFSDNNLDIPKLYRNNEPENSIFISQRIYTHDDWSICYVWETTQPHKTQEDNFNKIIVCVGEMYAY